MGERIGMGLYQSGMFWGSDGHVSVLRVWVVLG